ncbi:MAG TPA: SDR family oxidoreductase [Candidatus Acidoferrales bacterium]|nr:SDR family oxidoreductase [Candidatus Acidoferrales bacterium]
MDLGIRGRTALVTGASAGIGEAVALALAREGVKLALCARRRELLEAVASHAESLGAPAARAFPVDLGDGAATAATLSEVREWGGDVDIAILNGGGPKPGTFTETELADWESAYRTVLAPMVAIAGALVPAMRARRWGRIVALTSTSVKQPIANLVLSNAFRTGLVAALRTLAGEVAADGVTVNCIATGRVRTDRLRALYGGSDRKIDEAAAAEIPIGRVADPGEFAPLVAFLCGEPARYVTGQTISIDGGLTRGLFG